MRRRTPARIDNPFNTSGCEVLLFVCKCCLRCVAWFSYWFDNLGFFTEGNTYRRWAASSLHLWGNTNVASSDINMTCLPIFGTYYIYLLTMFLHETTSLLYPASISYDETPLFVSYSILFLACCHVLLIIWSNTFMRLPF